MSRTVTEAKPRSAKRRRAPAMSLWRPSRGAALAVSVKEGDDLGIYGVGGLQGQEVAGVRQDLHLHAVLEQGRVHGAGEDVVADAAVGLARQTQGGGADACAMRMRSIPKCRPVRSR